MYKIYLWKANGIPKYVGSTSLTITKRIQYHYSDKRSAIYKYIREHPDEEFSYVAIDYADTKEEAFKKEEFWTLFYRERYSMLNIFNGSTPDESVKRKISEATKGNNKGMIGKNHPFYGKHHTEESKKKTSKSLKGKFVGKEVSEETRKKLSTKIKEWYKTHTSPTLGKHLSEETKKKLSESHKGKLCGKDNPRARKVRIKETNMVFDTINECAEYLNVNKDTVSHSAHYNKKMKCGFTAEFFKDDK